MDEITGILEQEGIAVFDKKICGSIKGNQIYQYIISGSDCIDAWNTLFRKTDKNIIVLPENYNDGDILSDDEKSISADLSSYTGIDIQKWCERRWSGYDFDDEYDELEEIMMEHTGENISEPEPAHRFTLPYEIISNKIYDKMQLVDFRDIPFYEIPVYMQFGGWNACPFPEKHAAMLKHWNETYNASFFGTDGAVLEMSAENPPDTYEKAHILAKEQMAYCDDIVFQGTMTAERLAKTLVNSTAWYFWWD